MPKRSQARRSSSRALIASVLELGHAGAFRFLYASFLSGVRCLATMSWSCWKSVGCFLPPSQLDDEGVRGRSSSLRWRCIAQRESGSFDERLGDLPLVAGNFRSPHRIDRLRRSGTYGDKNKPAEQVRSTPTKWLPVVDRGEKPFIRARFYIKPVRFFVAVRLTGQPNVGSTPLRTREDDVVCSVQTMPN